MAKENTNKGKVKTTEERISKGQILARVIIEMLGAPKEHITQVMKDYIARVKESEHLDVIKDYTAQAEQKDNLFSIFSELEIWFPDLNLLVDFCFEVMPSSVEIIEPESFKLRSSEISGILNDVQSRMHTVDMTIKDLKAKSSILEKNGLNLLANLIALSLKKPKTLNEISIDVGIDKMQLEPFLKNLLENGKITSEDGKYIMGSQNKEMPVQEKSPVKITKKPAKKSK
jgi:hypothetical protein